LFSFRPDWHLQERANPLVRQYLLALDAVLEVRPELLGCDVVCAHCKIRFLTHPRNAGRLNLRCPFGCREVHRRQSSNRRGTAYRQTPEGQEKKRILNARRCAEAGNPQAELPTVPVESSDSPVVPVVDRQTVDVPLPDELPVKLELVLGEVVLDEAGLFASPMLPYVRMIVRVVEGLELGCGELVRWLLQVLRQRSIASRSRVDYVLRFLNEHPP
jgi:hypothetical protein